MKTKKNNVILPYKYQTSKTALQDTWLLTQKVLDYVKQQLLAEEVELQDPKLDHSQRIDHIGWYPPAWYHSFLQDTYMQPQYLHMYFAQMAATQY